MRRGDIWIASANDGFGGKPRPIVIIQNTLSIALKNSVIACLLTSETSDNPLLRINLQPNVENGLQKTSDIQTDKIITFKKERLIQKIGFISSQQLETLDESLKFWLGLS